MDRGISACDTLMKYLFLWLLPAMAECLVVTIIFATYFNYLPLAIAVFYFVFAYVVWTILITLWRKKFRTALVKHDNGTYCVRTCAHAIVFRGCKSDLLHLAIWSIHPVTRSMCSQLRYAIYVLLIRLSTNRLARAFHRLHAEF